MTYVLHAAISPRIGRIRAKTEAPSVPERSLTHVADLPCKVPGTHNAAQHMVQPNQTWVERNPYVYVRMQLSDLGETNPTLVERNPTRSIFCPGCFFIPTLGWTLNCCKPPASVLWGGLAVSLSKATDPPRHDLSLRIGRRAHRPPLRALRLASRAAGA